MSPSGLPPSSPSGPGFSPSLPSPVAFALGLGGPKGRRPQLGRGNTFGFGTRSILRTGVRGAAACLKTSRGLALDASAKAVFPGSWTRLARRITCFFWPLPPSLDFCFVPGDVIGVAGNHWDGYNKGRNHRTNRIGLYPEYKTEEQVRIVDFPTYPQVTETRNL